MKTSRLSQILLATAVIFASSAVYTVSSPAAVVETIGEGQIDWSSGKASATGTGAAPNKPGMSLGQKRLMAIQAARADAYRRLAELINGVQVDSETIVKDFVTESDIVRTKVSALIRGARFGEPRYLSDGTVEIDAFLGMYGQNSVASVIVPPALKKEDVQTQPIAVNEPPPPSGSYTGVIIDCRGMGVEPAMSPQILDTNGKEIYIGSLPVDPDLVVNIGIVAYADSLQQAQANARIGNNPLIIKAARSGGSQKTDAIITPEQGQQILQADSKSGFLSHSKVIFVVDK